LLIFIHLNLDSPDGYLVGNKTIKYGWVTNGCNAVVCVCIVVIL